ncbi:Nucleoside diphosphate-linked moiety X motif 22-like [Scleropages formosus]|uniref:Nucleoside diphosphate-linked moiety X motif 22-like n=1 Tax=Scleropages formosus TaxID=113540 RepID=A0A0P7UQS3_SCLFO|nr:Nucleoside diphosphate-linked moiety X motif 22-like [Scleropages formosus]
MMFNRRKFPGLERCIEEVWTERVTSEPWLFNGAKFRLHSAGTLAAHPNSNRARDADSCTQIFTPTCCYSERNTAVKKDTVLTMQLGLTCYKDFLGTNWSKNVKELMREGEIQFGNPESFLAQPLGVGAVLQTMDNHVVFLRRSQKVAEAPGLLDIPGGHPEPKAVCRGVSEESIQVEQLPEEAVVRELFSSVQTEIKDEVNIPLSCLSEPILMGIALNHTSAGRPSAEFYEVLKLEKSALLWSELCPSAKGAVLLYHLVRPDLD